METILPLMLVTTRSIFANGLRPKNVTTMAASTKTVSRVDIGSGASLIAATSD